MLFKDLMTYKRILIRHIYTSVISWCVYINNAPSTPGYLLALLRELSHVPRGLTEIAEAKQQVRQTNKSGILYSQSHLGWHFRKLKAQSSKVSFATFQWKETFELWALSFETAFENVTPSGIGCTSSKKGSKSWSSRFEPKFSFLFRGVQVHP